MRSLVRQVALEIAEAIYAEFERYEAAVFTHRIYEELKLRAADDSDLENEVFARAANEARRDVERAHEPHPESNGQLTFFDPEAVLIIGEGERVKMRVAKLDDALARDSVITNNYQRQSDAYFLEHNYWLERIGVWRDSDSALIDIERDHFGWVDESE